jgi:flagellar biosynthesis protein FlhF
MNMLSFLGETPTLALQAAQEECGEDAIVISTKKISDKRTNGKDMYEILVALEDDTQSDNVKHKIQIESRSNDTKVNAQFYDFKTEILHMQEEIKKVQKSLWEPKSKLYDLTVPSEFIDIYSLFEKK